MESREGYYYGKYMDTLGATFHFYEITRFNNNTITTHTEGIEIEYEGNPFNLIFAGAIKYF